VDLAHASALPLASLTALQTVHALEVMAGETVLVHGGSGGVGSFALQILADMGAVVLATASPENAEFIQSLGATPIDRHKDVVRQVQAVAPGGVDAVMELSGGPDAVRSTVPVMNDGSRVCSILMPPDLGEEAAGRGIKSRYAFVRPYGGQLADLSAMVDAGSLKIHLHDTYPLERTADAQRALEAGGHRGKIAITMGDG
jgi:NADPH:quinone reductase-like Zn-dependent oxidoreductase